MCVCVCVCVCLCVRLCVIALVFTLGFAVRDPQGSLDVEAVQDEHVLKDPFEVESCFMEDPGNCSSPFRKYMITNWSVEFFSWCVEPMSPNFTMECVKMNHGFGKWECPFRCRRAGFTCAQVSPKILSWKNPAWHCSARHDTCRVDRGGRVVDKTS